MNADDEARKVLDDWHEIWPFEPRRLAVLGYTRRLEHQLDEAKTYAWSLEHRIASLERWKAEAIRVLTDWEAVWTAAGEPGGLGDYRPTVTTAAVSASVGRAAALEQRIAAARTALDKAWRAAPDYLCGDLDEVLDVLEGHGHHVPNEVGCVECGAHLAAPTREQYRAFVQEHTIHPVQETPCR